MDPPSVLPSVILCCIHWCKLHPPSPIYPDLTFQAFLDPDLPLSTLLRVLSSSPVMASNVGALFTDEWPAVCEGSSCPHRANGRPVPPVDYMLSARQGMGGRWLCAECLEYYCKKSAAAGAAVPGMSPFQSFKSDCHIVPTNTHTAWFTTPSSVQPQPDSSGIRHANAAGQRGGM